MGYFDLGWEARTNPKFQRQIYLAAKELEELEKNLGKDPSAPRKIAEVLQDVYKYCQYNPTFLLPHMFPQYPGAEPLSLANRTFATAMMDFRIGGFTAVRGSRQIGKSTTFVARQLANAHLIPRWRSLYICPHTEHQRTYANKMHEMELAFRYFKTRHDFRSNLNYKEYPNGAMIELIRVLTSTAAARGKMGDELLYDEYQLFDPDFEPDIEQIQTVSQMPVRIYAGTSTHLDSPLEHRYQGSSQGVWFTRTHYSGDDTAKRWIDTSDPDQVIPIIQPQGPTCPHTGHLLDMTNGCWVHKQQGMMELNRIGIHIPQLIIPNLVNSTKGWLKIFTEFQDYPRDKFLQEVLGIPTEAGSREITEADLKNICLNPDGPNTRLKKSINGWYRYVVSGCDWGGSEFDPTHGVKTSFSVHVIMGLNPYGNWELLHIERYPGMDYRMVVDDIVRNHLKFKADIISSDYGVGMAYNSWIRAHPDIPANKHLVFQLGGTPTSPILAPFNTKEAYNCFTLNKTESITGLFAAIKDDPPEIIGYDWGDIRKYLLDFLNIYRVPHETDTGARRFRYIRNPSRSDDVVQAMNFALAGGRIMQGRSVFEDESLLEVVQSRLRGNPNAGLGPSGSYLVSG